MKACVFHFFILRKAADYVLKAALPFFFSLKRRKKKGRTPIENDRYPIPPVFI
jgi:hypothetical protein